MGKLYQGLKFCFSLSLVFMLNFVYYFINIDLWYYYMKIIELNGPIFIKFFQHIGEYNKHLPFLNGKEKYLRKIKENINYHSKYYTQKIIKKYNLKLKLIAGFCKSGSLGQIHKCTYQDKMSCLKILHPNIKNDINDNFYIFNKLLDIFGNKYQIDREGLYQSIMDQSNFSIEAKNYIIFNKNFQNYSNIIFPKVYYSNNEVIISEFIHFPDQDLISKENYIKGVIIYVISIYKMIFIDNFIHGDLHSGNWKIIPNFDSENTKIVFFDTAIFFKVKNLTYLRKTFYYNLINDKKKLLFNILKFLEKEEFYDPLIENFKNTNNPWNYVLQNILKLLPGIKIKDEYIYILNTLNSCREYLGKINITNIELIRKIKEYEYDEILNIFDMVDLEINEEYIIFNEPRRRIIIDKKNRIKFANYI